MKKICISFLTVLIVFSTYSIVRTYAFETRGSSSVESSNIVNGIQIADTNNIDSDDGIINGDETEDQENIENSQTHQGVVSLKDKTVMIVGNSMVYYGNCVIKGDAGKQDYGYFYQLAAANDENVTVIDHTYSGKKLDYIYENYLVKISKEERDSVDYLVLSEGNQVNEDLVGTCEKILALFPEDVEFRFLRQPMMFESNMPSLINGVEALREKGYIVVDWGKLVYDIHSGAVQVPGATMEFKRSSFMKENLGYKNGQGTVISAGNSGDRNHQNPLSGYVTAQMLYTSITNRSAVYTDYSFCYDTSIHPYFDIDGFANVHYTGPDKTNFHDIFRSTQDMIGLQMLMDTYLFDEGVHPLTVRPSVEPNCVRAGLTEGSYCAYCDQTIEKQQIIEVDANSTHQPVFIETVRATCTTEGLTGGVYCGVCGLTIMNQETILPFGHTPEQHITSATLTEDGTIEEICATCGEVLKAELVSKVANIKLSKDTYIYNGKKQTPNVIVEDSLGKTLVKGIDYKLIYSSGRKNINSYNITVKFIGNYDGSKELVYNILPDSVKSINAKAYVKTVKLSWEKVEKATHYRIYRYDSFTKTYKRIAVTKKTSYTFTELTSGKKYKFK